MQKADRHQTALITPIRTGGLIAKRPAAAEYDQAIRRVANKTGVPVLEVGPYFRRLTEPGNAPRASPPNRRSSRICIIRASRARCIEPRS